jgi:hypothetical protein
MAKKQKPPNVPDPSVIINGAVSPEPTTNPLTSAPESTLTVPADLPINQPPVLTSPSSITTDFKFTDLISVDRKPVSMPVDTGIEVVYVDRPSRFVALHPQYTHGWIIPEDRKIKRPTYIVSPALAMQYRPPCREVRFIAWVEPLMEDCVWPSYGIWPVKLEPPSGGDISDYSKSAIQKIDRAIQDGGWYSFATVQTQQAYKMSISTAITQTPKWPNVVNVVGFLLEKAFEGRIITTPEHPVLRGLIGKPVL